ncbi:MAG: signal peptidase I [Clostridiales bacterium]|nr:signal peptidase I [Clostridiales bacterium]
MNKGEREGRTEVFNTDFITDYTINYSDAEPDDGGRPEKKQRKAAIGANMGLYDWVQCIVTAVITGVMIFVFIGRVDGIKGTSMMQTLQNGDAVILSKLFYTPKFQDIIFIKTEYYGDTPIVKRVIGTAGQTVDIDFDRGVVFIDGVELQESYVNTPTTLRIDFTGSVTVPEGHVFVMGDNRNDSSDSRNDNIGMIDVDDIIGKVYFILVPGKGYDTKRDWSRIGPVY